MTGERFLDGDSVSLHPVTDDDLPFLRDALNRPEIRIPLGSVDPTTVAEQRDRRESDDDSLDLLVVADGDRVGAITLSHVDGENGHAHLGYWVHPDHQRRGYATDAATAVLDHAFAERRLHTVVAHVYAFNEGSVALLEALGFERTGRYPDWEYHDGAFHDDLVYAVTRDGWGS